MVNSQLFKDATLGQFGFQSITDTSAHTGAWNAILVTSDAVFATLTADNSTTTAYTAVTVPAWTWLYGRFTAITLTSGKVAAYKERPGQA